MSQENHDKLLFTSYKHDFILNLTPDKAREIGIKHRSALAYLKKKAKGGDLNFKSRNVRRITFGLFKS